MLNQVLLLYVSPSVSEIGESQTLSDAMSCGEFIELHDLRSDREEIELTRSPLSPPRLERTNALRISPGRVPDLLSRVGIIRVLSSSHDPQIPEEKGEGHNFQPCSHAQPTWCDLCGDFIWGLYKQSLRCVSKSASCNLCVHPVVSLSLCMCKNWRYVDKRQEDVPISGDVGPKKSAVQLLL